MFYFVQYQNWNELAVEVLGEASGHTRSTVGGDLRIEYATTIKSIEKRGYWKCSRLFQIDFFLGGGGCNDWTVEINLHNIIIVEVEICQNLL